MNSIFLRPRQFPKCYVTGIEYRLVVVISRSLFRCIIRGGAQILNESISTLDRSSFCHSCRPMKSLHSLQIARRHAAPYHDPWAMRILTNRAESSSKKCRQDPTPRTTAQTQQQQQQQKDLSSQQKTKGERPGRRRRLPNSLS